MYVCATCVSGASRTGDGFGSPGTGVTESWESPRECWKQTQAELLTAEPALQFQLLVCLTFSMGIPLLSLGIGKQTQEQKGDRELQQGK